MRLYQVWCEGPNGFRSRIGEPMPKEKAQRFRESGDFPHTRFTVRAGRIEMHYRYVIAPVEADER